MGEALGVDLTLPMPRSADAATLARAIQSLTDAGMSIEDAREVVGLSWRGGPGPSRSATVCARCARQACLTPEIAQRGVEAFAVGDSHGTDPPSCIDVEQARAHMIGRLLRLRARCEPKRGDGVSARTAS